jgi:dipeptidyl-peptidase-4
MAIQHPFPIDASRAARRAATALAILAAFALSGTTGRSQALRLTVERIASLPSLTGTAPSSPVWSPDSRHVAFLWNDRGLPFRDVWVASATSTGPPVRVTAFAEQQPATTGSDTSLEALMNRAAARARGGVSGVTWWPDGHSLVVNYDGVLYRAALDASPPTQLTQAAGSTQVAFSPDGRFLSFLRAGDLWLWAVETGALVQATHVGAPPIGTSPGGAFVGNDVQFRSFAWAPDSSRVALNYEDRREVRQVPFPNYIGEETSMNMARRGYPGDEGSARAVAIYHVREGITRFVDLPERTGRNILGYEWSPDGAHLLIEQDSDEGEVRWIYAVRRADGSTRELLRDHRERRIYSIFTSAWRSDSAAVLYIDDSDRHYRLRSLPLAGGPPATLTPGSYDVAGERGAATVTVAGATRHIFFVSSQKSPYERQVYRVPEAGGPVGQVTSSAGVHSPFVAPNGMHVAVLHSSDLSPTELYIVDVNAPGAERRITHSPPPEFSSYQWARPKYVTFKSRIDGFTLHGRLVLPPDLDPSKKYPVVIGSVYSNTVRNEWRGLNQSLQQFMALEGKYINLQVDLRGSVGYGVAFREAFQGDWGGGDLEDLHSAVDYLKTLPYVDPDRIGIWGSSYGGMMVLFALFERPGMFKAGVAGAPAIEVARFTSGDQHLSRRPSSHPQIFRKSTLLNYGERLQDPLLLIHGLQDDIVPFKSTVMMAEKLMALGKDFDIAIAPRSVHGWTRQEHYAVFMMRKLVQHFDRHLGPGPTPTRAHSAGRP